MYFLNLLAESVTSGSSSSQAQPTGLPSWVIWIVFALLIVVLIVPSYFRNKKYRKMQEEKMAKLGVGARVTTIGMLYGEVVNVDDEKDLVTIKTGYGDNISYVTFLKTAISQVEEPISQTAETDVYEQPKNQMTFEEAIKAEEAKENAESQNEQVEEVEETTETNGDQQN